jgi:hypothetical protein
MPYNSFIQQAQGREREARGQAGTSRSLYGGALSGFDPQSYMQQAAGAAYGGLSEDFAGAERGRKASLNRRGLMGSNIGGAESERGFQDRLAQALAGLSMQAGQMEQNRIGQMGDLYRHDVGRADQYFGHGVDLTMSREHQRAQDKASKRGMWGSIAGAGLTAAGMALGGPAGGAIGSGLSKALFRR